MIENYVCWQIRDPERFLQALGDTTAAEMRLHDIAWSGLAAALGNYVRMKHLNFPEQNHESVFARMRAEC